VVPALAGRATEALPRPIARVALQRAIAVVAPRLRGAVLVAEVVSEPVRHHLVLALLALDEAHPADLGKHHAQ
jgi:hypothetical protein